MLCVSVDLPYTHVWNTVVTSGLVPLFATWNCQTSYKNKYAGYWSFTCCFSWTLGSSPKCGQLKSFPSGYYTRPYRDHLTAPSQLKLAEYFHNWVFLKFLNPIKLKNKYYWFFVHTCSYKLQFDYDHLLITLLH